MREHEAKCDSCTHRVAVQLQSPMFVCGAARYESGNTQEGSELWRALLPGRAVQARTACTSVVVRRGADRASARSARPPRAAADASTAAGAPAAGPTVSLRPQGGSDCISDWSGVLGNGMESSRRRSESSIK